jgi:hypothetical protein
MLYITNLAIRHPYVICGYVPVHLQ